MKTLIIEAGLVNPPTESLAFRFLTSITKDSLDMDNLLQVEANVKDIYYSYMKKLGMHDYIDALVTPEEKENGVYLTDRKDGYHNPIILIDRINFSNLQDLFNLILNWSG